MRNLLSLHQAAAALLAALTLAASAQRPPATTVEVDGDTVRFHGQINETAAAEFLRLLAERPVTRLVITSGGGQVAAALDMAQAIHERQLDVEVPTACHSSCANYIFPAARAKLIGHASAVAWHGNMEHVLYLQQTGRARWDERLMEGARYLARREAEFFRRIGVDGFVCWFAKIAPYDVHDFYSLPAEDMERFGIRQVTLRDAQPGAAAAADGVRVVRADWSGMRGRRPVVALD